MLAELDRIGEENDIRFMLPTALDRRPAARYAAAFRAHGIDLAAAPRAEAVGWLTGHRFRDRLTAAVRNWRLSLLPFPTGPELALRQSAPALAAVAGEVGSAAARLQPILRDRLGAVLDAVTEDPFAREWWAAAGRRDAAALKALLARPELGRMSSRELSSLADGLADAEGDDKEVFAAFLHAAYDRFPGDFWVNFRLASSESLNRNGKDEEERVIRHLSAAVAARPRSAVARVVLGSALCEQQKGDPTGLRLLHGAAELDPDAPWAHLFLGWMAMEEANFADAARAFERAVRADPDTAFVMIQPFVLHPSSPVGGSTLPRRRSPA